MKHLLTKKNVQNREDIVGYSCMSGCEGTCLHVCSYSCAIYCQVSLGIMPA